jgi:nicotinamidase-related amidase
MTKALLIVDMVKGFIEPDVGGERCTLYIDGAKQIIPNINREIAALEKDDILIFVCDAHSDDDEEFKTWQKHCVIGSGQEEIADGIMEPKDAPLRRVNKTRFSGFFQTTLESKLFPYEIDEVIITGVCTDICVFATALDARYRDYAVTIPKDCVFPLDRARGDYLLDYLKNVAGVKIR